MRREPEHWLSTGSEKESFIYCVPGKPPLSVALHKSRIVGENKEVVRTRTELPSGGN